MRALHLLCQAPATHQATSVPELTGGKAAFKKHISQLKGKKALSWKQMTLLSQIQAEPCLKGTGLAISALWKQPWNRAQFLALSVTCCVIPGKLLFFSMTSVSQLQYWQKTKPNIKDIRWSIAVIRRLKLDQQKRIRSLHLQHPSKKKKKTFSTARKATYPDDSQQGN